MGRFFIFRLTWWPLEMGADRFAEDDPKEAPYKVTLFSLLPIWLYTGMYSAVFTQMASLFVQQGAAMDKNISGFRIPAASMSAFDIISVAVFILYRLLIHPLVSSLCDDPKGLTELQRMGLGLIILVRAMASAGTAEHFQAEAGQRRRRHTEHTVASTSVCAHKSL